MTEAVAGRMCVVCAAPIDHLRPDAKCCGAGCRGRKSRAEPWMPPGNCNECALSLPLGRADRAYCSDRCRSKAHRRQAREARIAVLARACRCETPQVVAEDGEHRCHKCGRKAR